jgi:hypothetical protein
MDSPDPPDPVATAKAQAQMNKETAIVQQGLNSTNQVTPWGNLTYKQIGTWPDGTPRYEATTALSDGQQQLFDNWQTAQTNLGQIGIDQTQRIREMLGTPIDMSNDAVEGRLFELGSKRLDPMFQERESQMRADLVNRGIREGTPAFDAEMRNFTQGRNDAYNNLALTGRGQAIQEMLTQRNQPINEITALMSGSQVSNPNFQNTPQTSVNGVDYAGMVMNNYNQEMGQHNAMMGGLFGLGGAAIGGWGKAGFPMPSDERLKDIIAHIATTDKGIKLYLFRYNEKAVATFGMPTYEHIGVIAQQIQDQRPDCVVERHGFLMVDYEKLFAE